MATTVRRVKQEARLRRSGANSNNNGSSGANGYLSNHSNGVAAQAAYSPSPRRMPPAEAEGYGPYKPVPPPKPLPAASAQASPPPYRLPPGLSLVGLPGLSPGLPGTAADPVAEPLSPSPRQLHTHSSKFPIEREVILSGSDKDSKIPILHEYKKQRPKSAVAIAPDAPSRSLAWTEDKKGGGMQHEVELRCHPMAGTTAASAQQGHQGGHHGLGQSYGLAASHDALDAMGHVVYKAQPLHVTQDSPVSQPRPVSYHPGTTNHEAIYGSTPSAMPRTWTTTDSPTRSRQQIERQQQLHAQQQRQQQQQHQAMTTTARQLQQQDMYAITVDPSATSTPTAAEANGVANGVANGAKDATPASSNSKAFPSRTYHSIKDLISSRFGSKDAKQGKDADVESALNNLQQNGGTPQQAAPASQAAQQTPQAASRHNGVAEDAANQTARTPTTPRQRVAAAGGRTDDDYQHLSAAAQRGAGQTPYRQADEDGVYGSTAARYGKVPVNSPYQRVPMPHAAHAEPIYQRYPQSTAQPMAQPGTPSKQPQQQQQQQQMRPQQGSSNAAVSSPQTLLREHGVYMVMRQPLYGQTKAQEHPAEGMYGQTKPPPPPQSQPPLLDEAPKGVTYGGGLYQVVHEPQGKHAAYPPDAKSPADPNEMYVDQDPYGRTVSAGATPGPAAAAAAADQQNGGAAAPQARRGSVSQPHAEDDDEGGFVSDRTRQSGRGDVTAANPSSLSLPSAAPSSNPSGSSSSDYDKAGSGTGLLSRQSQSDSGRGSTVYSSGPRSKAGAERPANGQTCIGLGALGLDAGLGAELPTSPQTPGGHPCEWVDMVESELRQILDNSLGNTTAANSTLSESISSMTPPLPPLSPGGSSPGGSPRASARYNHSQSLPYGTKPDYSMLEFGSRKGVHGLGAAVGLSSSAKRVGHGGVAVSAARGWRPGKQLERSHKKKDQLQMSAKGGKIPLSALGLEDGARLDLDSMLDGATNTEENNTSEEDEDMSTTVDGADTRAIRKQLEGLEGMYSEVLKLLGVRKQRPRYQPSDPRVNKRRLYGSMSSLPSSVSSRPVRDLRDRRNARHDDRKKVRDFEGINKRFQRLESHVVTLARSVAHLSSEMRTQHLMIREMEHIRSEMASLRTQTNMIAARSQSQSVPRGLNQLLADKDPRKDRLRDPAAITNPSRVKKLTKFFGDEPPLLRLFLKKLGYEKYAGAFEQERVGMVELPYLTEERLQKMGIPMGPRLRILQEAQISACRDTVYVV